MTGAVRLLRFVLCASVLAVPFGLVVGQSSAAVPRCPAGEIQGSLTPLDREPDYLSAPVRIGAGERAQLGVRCKSATGRPRLRTALCVAGLPEFGRRCWRYVVGSDAWRYRTMRFTSAGRYRVSFHSTPVTRPSFSLGLIVLR